MTSQHFATNEVKEDWGDWGDWGENGNNNNNNTKTQIQPVQPVQPTQQQNFTQPPQSTPIYSPFGYQQQQQPPQHVHQPQHIQQGAPLLFNQRPPTASPITQQMQYNSQNFFNSPNFGDNVNNNQQLHLNTSGHPTPVTAPLAGPPPPTNYYEQLPKAPVANQMYRQDEPKSALTNPLQYQSPPPSSTTAGFQGTQQAFVPSPSTSPLQLPPPPQAENITDDLYSSNQQQHLPAPPTIPNFDKSSVRIAQEQPIVSSYQYQPAAWTLSSVAPTATNPIDSFNVAPSTHNWQTSPMNYAQPQQQQPQPLQAPSLVNHAASLNPSAVDPFAIHHSFNNNYTTPADPRPHEAVETFAYRSNATFFENREAASVEQVSGQHGGGQMITQPPPPPAAMPSFVAQQATPENDESFQVTTTVDSSLSAPPRSTPSAEVFYPENRERLDDVSLPPTTAAPSFTDRHNYLVTGQLSQDRTPWAQHNHHQVQFESTTNFIEELPPPGLSRMVVGQPENNQEQVAVSDVPPPGLNRMVPGTEMSPSNYINYQRQADGEVSQTPPAVQRPQSNSPFTHAHHQNIHQSAPDAIHQSFNTSDRNLYLVAGESGVNSHRVIPGVESDSNAPTSISSQMQNLHIQDVDGFVNVSVSVQERNVNVDGMETSSEQRLVEPERREEDIDGANDNTETFNPGPVLAILEHGLTSNELENDAREEAIEGANDYNDDARRSSEVSKSKLEKKQKTDSAISSEDSELRALETNKVKPKPRRSKKYADDSNESENEFSEGEKREKYRRQPREKMSREDHDAYRRKEKERRSGERPRKGDDTDGSKYGETRRRTDDEDDSRRLREKHQKSARRPQENEVLDDKERKKREKYRESGSRRKDYAYEDDRRDRRRRERYHDDESYSGRRSQNASDREYVPERYTRRSREHAEKDRKYDAASYYQQYAGANYDATNYNYSSYYQQQQYYETLRRTNPQAYYEWYTKYIAMMQQAQARQQQPTAAVDDVAGSMRSGYSSSNEKDRLSTSRFLPGGDISNPIRSMNSSFIDNTDYQSFQGYPTVGKDPNQSYGSLNFNQSYGYDVYSRGKTGTTETQRLTPKKFQSLHSFVRLSNGLITTIDASNADSGYTVKIENISVADKSRRLYQSYPGPLVKGSSHKKTVIEFCEEKLKQDQSIVASQRASYSLLWSLLILMLRQNGNYTEADVSELLMKNSEEFKATLDVQSTSVSDENKNATNEDNTDVSESEENAASEKNSNSASNSHEETTNMSTMSDKVILHKFRDYLLYGNINDALDFATDNNLWGHALFLASKVDRRQHANVMLKFANKLPYNDPLQTLYQIMSGRMPACVTNLDDKWGDWRPHLAMIVSNCTDKPDLVKRSIIALADSLANRGDVFGSQFCYLLVDPHFKEYSDHTSDCKIALLGTSHQRPFREFATDDAIVMSEVYEYARSLSDERFFVPSLQKYKFLLAGKMLDYGMQLKCLLYMEQIAKCIVAQPDAFDKNFTSQVYSLADRLKFYDPVMEKSYEDNFNNNGLDATEDQKWLQDLSTILNEFDDGSNNFQPVQEPTPQHSSSEVYNPLSYSAPSVPQAIYDPMSQHQTPTHPVTTNYEVDESYQSNQDQPNSSFNQNLSTNEYQQQQQTPPQQVDQAYAYEYNNPMAGGNQNQIGSQPTYAEQAPYDPSSHGNYQQQQQQQQASQPDYGYGWDQSAYPQQPQPTITMGNTTSNKFNDSHQKGGGEGDKKKSPAKKQEGEKNKKVLSQDAQGGGWFGGIFSKLSMKPKNQMILPDDKNPTILWDDATKKWVNKDGEGAEVESFKPPPKMGDMMGSSPQPPQMMQMQTAPIPQMNQYSQPQLNPPAQVPSNPMEIVSPAFIHQQPAPVQAQPALNQPQPQMNSMSPAPENATQQPPAAAAPNMFKMQKGRNLKKSYVDILGNSGQTVSQPKELTSQMDMQFFNPIQQQQQGMQFYNPNDFQ